VVKTPLLLPPSTTATVDNAAIGAVSSIPLSPPSTTTAIIAVNDHHCRCYTVNDNDRQKPMVVVSCQRQQRQSLLTEAAVDGNHGKSGLQRRQLLSMEAVVGWSGMMTQWHRQQWHLWPMVAAAMVVVVINCAAAVGAAATIPSSALTAMAKMPLLPPPSTAASIEDNCYCCH
jgi:hypothetical protein